MQIINHKNNKCKDCKFTEECQIKYLEVSEEVIDLWVECGYYQELLKSKQK